jgi:predicted amidohydrolase
VLYLMRNISVVAGSEVRVVDMGFAKVGLSTCFDVRFPSLYQQLCEKG